MPDLKISQLPVATTPLAGTELVPIVQGGVTDRTTVAAFLSAGLPVSATTLSASGAVTLSGGTANGVLYLDGSKVATSGSALVFDGNNLGIGVTPSAWTTSFSQKAFQLTSSSVFAGDINSSYFATNWFVGSGGSTYIKNNFALRYTQDGSNGQHQWFTAPSGTAGTAISFTQAMTLDASGNLGIGTTSPDAKLDVVGPLLVGLFGSETVNNAYVGFKYNNTILGYVGNGSGVASGSAATEFSIGSTGARALTFGTNDFERARIDSAGNFLTLLQTAAPTLATNNQMVFTLTSDTNLRVSVRGSDGVTRTANLTLA